MLERDFRMDASENYINARREIALKRCNEQIKWYEDHASHARILYRAFQSAVVILGGLTPVLALWSEEVSRGVQALPAALAAIVAGISGFWRWQENWIRFGYTAEALKSELVKFETRATEAYRASLNEEQALENFVIRIEDLAIGEVSEWRTRLSQTESKPSDAE